MASMEELKGIARGLYESGIQSEKRFIFIVLTVFFIPRPSTRCSLQGNAV
jgi:hypothetical protein